MGNGTGISWDLCPGTEISGLGTDFLGTLGTGTNTAGTVRGQKSLRQANPKLWDQPWFRTGEYITIFINF